MRFFWWVTVIPRIAFNVPFYLQCFAFWMFNDLLFPLFFLKITFLFNLLNTFQSEQMLSPMNVFTTININISLRPTTIDLMGFKVKDT